MKTMMFKATIILWFKFCII